jgi:hypothetical protein
MPSTRFTDLVSMILNRHKLRLIIAGDMHYFTHHAPLGGAHCPTLVVSGGGGAFTHSTHALGKYLSFHPDWNLLLGCNYTLEQRYPSTFDSVFVPWGAFWYLMSDHLTVAFAILVSISIKWQFSKRIRCALSFERKARKDMGLSIAFRCFFPRLIVKAEEQVTSHFAESDIANITEFVCTFIAFLSSSVLASKASVLVLDDYSSSGLIWCYFWTTIFWALARLCMTRPPKGRESSVWITRGRTLVKSVRDTIMVLLLHFALANILSRSLHSTFLPFINMITCVMWVNELNPAMDATMDEYQDFISRQSPNSVFLLMDRYSKYKTVYEKAASHTRSVQIFILLPAFFYLIWDSLVGPNQTCILPYTNGGISLYVSGMAMVFCVVWAEVTNTQLFVAIGNFCDETYHPIFERFRLPLPSWIKNIIATVRLLRNFILSTLSESVPVFVFPAFLCLASNFGCFPDDFFVSAAQTEHYKSFLRMIFNSDNEMLLFRLS